MTQKVIRSDGQEADKPSVICPKCSTKQITSTTATDMTFDENGWYKLISFVCKNPKCRGIVKEKGKKDEPFKWNEKLIVMGGGESHDFREFHGFS